MRYRHKAISFIIALLGTASPGLAAPNAESASDIVIACEQLLADYAIYRDHLDADGFANTFSEDGVLVLGSGTYRGRTAVRENITSRPAPRVAHMILMTSVQITPIDETAAAGIAYAIVLNGDRPVEQGDAPIQMRGITSAVEYHTEFVLTDDGWKISRLELKSIFRGPGIA
ncbi:MAG TPA: nuclear transport factor 2 family protein [Gammaproteobacteria bacterium]|nr:nuclear transport factor 2 family protein [Gammaproteobacteria bacterium]